MRGAHFLLFDLGWQTNDVRLPFSYPNCPFQMEWNRANRLVCLNCRMKRQRTLFVPDWIWNENLHPLFQSKNFYQMVKTNKQRPLAHHKRHLERVKWARFVSNIHWMTADVLCFQFNWNKKNIPPDPAHHFQWTTETSDHFICFNCPLKWETRPSFSIVF